MSDKVVPSFMLITENVLYSRSGSLSNEVLNLPHAFYLGANE